MRNRFIYSVMFVLAIGCGPSTEDSKRDHQPLEHVATLAESAAQDAADFAHDLAHLTQSARDLESKFDFNGAANIWTQVYKRVEKRFGIDSWQVKNAEVAYASAVRNAKLSPENHHRLVQLAQINKEIKQAYENRQISNALKLSLQLLEQQADLYGEDSIDAGQQMIQIASFESMLSFIDRAIGNYHRGITILEKNGYSNHPELEIAHAGLASLYTRKKKYAPAVANQKAATQIAGQIWGIQSLNYATQANQLGVIYQRAGILDVACEILNRSKQIRQDKLGPDSVQFAHSCLNLGVVMLDMRQLTEAQQLLTNAHSIFQAELGKSDTLTIRCKSQLATVHMLRKQPELAEPYLSDVVAAMQQAEGDQPESLLTHQYRLAVALAKQGKYDRARPLIEHLIEKQQGLFGLSDNRTVASMRAYAMLLEATHQSESAAEVKQQINRVAHLIDNNDFQKRY